MSDDPNAWRFGVEPTVVGLGRMQVAIGLDDPLETVRRLGGGIGASTHLVRAGDRNVVLKQYPADRSEVVRREFDGLSLARARGLPVPAPLAVDVDGSWFGLPALAMSYVEGQPELRPTNLVGFIEGVTDLLVDVHSVDIEAAGAALPTTSDRVALREAPVVIPEGLLVAMLVRRIVARINTLVADAQREPPVFNHGDLHPGNLLWQGGRISALVDWSHAGCRHTVGRVGLFPHRTGRAHGVVGGRGAAAELRGTGRDPPRSSAPERSPPPLLRAPMGPSLARRMGRARPIGSQPRRGQRATHRHRRTSPRRLTGGEPTEKTCAKRVATDRQARGGSRPAVGSMSGAVARCGGSGWADARP